VQRGKGAKKDLPQRGEQLNAEARRGRGAESRKKLNAKMQRSKEAKENQWGNLTQRRKEEEKKKRDRPFVSSFLLSLCTFAPLR
jgi:hypothetical protein